jgi:hypothetical protein
MGLFGYAIVKENHTPLQDELNALLNAWEDAIGKRPTGIVMSRETRRALVNEIAKDRRFVNTMKFDHGEEAIEYDGLPVFASTNPGMKNGWMFALTQRPWEIGGEK